MEDREGSKLLGVYPNLLFGNQTKGLRSFPSKTLSIIHSSAATELTNIQLVVKVRSGGHIQ